VEGSCQGERGRFALVQAAGRINRFRRDYLKPTGRCDDPTLNGQRRNRAGQFSLNGDWDDYSREQAGKQIDMPDQDQVVYGTGVGDDQLHRLEAQALQVGDISIDIFDRDVFIHGVGFEEAVQLQAGQPKHLAKLGFCNVPSLQFLKGEGLQGPA
jgi:hypothetical protein